MKNKKYHFVSHNIGEELLWPLSMPPTIFSENEIPIGSFGSSNEGFFKHVYRLGLANRYGRNMQAISGFHFNYSLPEKIWDLSQVSDEKNLKYVRSKMYFNMIRNIYKMNWILIYLFGASPVINKQLVKNKNESFVELDDDYLYLPNSTSLRMSEYGYSNSSRKKISISVNSLDEYVSDLIAATQIIEERYKSFDEDKNAQLNSNILQIEAEHYAVARAKTTEQKAKRMTTDLGNQGVDFIEIRSLDLNPFSAIGIDRETVLFLEIFMLVCLLDECENFDQRSVKDINNNDIIVAKYGRNINTLLMSKDSKISVKDWGNQILERMDEMVFKINFFDKDYELMIKNMRSRINNPEETPSSRILEEMHSKKISYMEFGNNLAERYKKYYFQKEHSSNLSWGMLEDEARISIKKQEEMEADTRKSNQTFKQFKQEYFNN